MGFPLRVVMAALRTTCASWVSNDDRQARSQTYHLDDFAVGALWKRVEYALQWWTGLISLPSLVNSCRGQEPRTLTGLARRDRCMARALTRTSFVRIHNQRHLQLSHAPSTPTTHSRLIPTNTTLSHVTHHRQPNIRLRRHWRNSCAPAAHSTPPTTPNLRIKRNCKKTRQRRVFLSISEFLHLPPLHHLVIGSKRVCERRLA